MPSKQSEAVVEGTALGMATGREVRRVVLEVGEGGAGVEEGMTGVGGKGAEVGQRGAKGS